MNEIRFEEQEGFGVAPKLDYPLPGPEANRKFISFALTEEVRDPYSDVPRSVGFSRKQCDDLLKSVDDQALDSIARKLGDEFLSTAYLHMMVSAVHHRESGDMISNLDYFFEDDDETREPATWNGDRSETYDVLSSAIKGMTQYRHLGFAGASNYRHAEPVVQGQARALLTVTRLIMEDYRNPVGVVPLHLTRSVTAEGAVMLTLSEDRMVHVLLRNYDQLDEMVDYITQRDSYDAQMLEEIMDQCRALREGAL